MERRNGTGLLSTYKHSPGGGVSFDIWEGLYKTYLQVQKFIQGIPLGSKNTEV